MNFFALKAFQGFSEIPPLYWSFPDSSVGKESACNAGDPGSIPGLGRSCGEGNGYSLQYSGLENSMGSLYSSWGHQEADTTERLFTSPHFCCIAPHRPTGRPALDQTKSREAGTETSRVCQTRVSYPKVLGDSPVCIVDSRQDVAEASLLRGEGGFPLRGE